MASSAELDNAGNATLPLCAHLTDIQVKDAPKVRTSYVVVIYVDGEKKFKSKKRTNGSWQEDHRFFFRPSSAIKVAIFRKSAVPLRNKHLVGQYIGKMVELLESYTDLDLKNETDTLIPTRIFVKLALISDFAQEIMQGVDSAIPRLGGHGVVGQVSGVINTSVTAYDDAETAGTCIAPLGQALQLIVKIMDNVADAHPILKASWIVLSSAYKAVQQQLVQDDSLRDLAESLREMVSVASACPDLRNVKGTANVIEDIGHASMQVASLIDEYTKSKHLAARIIRFQISNDMRSRIDQCQQGCKSLMEKFDRRVGIDTNERVKELARNNIDVQHNVQVIKDDGLSNKIYQWLAAPDPSRNYNEAREKYQENTGFWFINSPQFAEWKMKPDILLWVRGMPGSGKTILCSTIIENIIQHCKTDVSLACAYFFFDGRDSQPALQLHENLIRSLIKQFSVQCGNIPNALVQLYGGGHQQPQIHSLKDVLLQILDRFQEAYLIIDSLDECSDRGKLLGWIAEIMSWKVAKLHLLTTSRSERDIETHMQSLDACSVTLEGESVASDIEKYIDWTLQGDKWKFWDKLVLDQVKMKLMEDAGAMFRLVAFQFKELQDCYTPADLKEQLNHLPKDLDAMYDQMLSKITKKNHLHAHKILQWLAFSAHPLSLAEIAEVVAVDLQSLHFDPDHRLHPQFVLDMCAGLVTTNSKGQAKLAHMSVKEYLLPANGRPVSGFSISTLTSHVMISQTCLTYLLHIGKMKTIASIIQQQFPLAEYAANQWIFHVQSAGGDSVNGLPDLIMDIHDPGSAAFATWIQLYNPWDYGMRIDKHASQLYCASLAGFLKTSQGLLEKGANVNAQGGHYGNALQAAASGGHDKIVNLLVEKGADVNAQRGHYSNALQAAAFGGHDKIVNVLLEKGSDVNAQGGVYGNALQAAASGGHDKIVNLLLEKGADVNAQGGDYGNALQAAAFGGHDKIVNLLLEKGVDVNAQGDVYGNALQVAASEGHDKIVNLLLEKGADVNAQGGEYGNALQEAAFGGHDKIVSLLLEKGADVNAQGDVYGNALQRAVSEGHDKIVNLLLEKGADVNAQGGDYGNALQEAAIGGHDKIVSLLLEKGVDVNAQGGLYGNALYAAASGGHDKIVNLLLEKGADVNAQGGHYGNALQAAAFGGHDKIVNLLLEKGVDVNAQGGLYGNALYAAASGGHDKIVNLLLEKGADVNTQKGHYGNIVKEMFVKGVVSTESV